MFNKLNDLSNQPRVKATIAQVMGCLVLEQVISSGLPDAWQNWIHLAFRAVLGAIALRNIFFNPDNSHCSEKFVPETANAPTAVTCTRPPAGWYCTREAGHEGPCAAVPVKTSDVDSTGSAS